MFEDFGFIVAQSLTSRLMKSLGIPEDWQPKSSLGRAILWSVVIGGGAVVLWLIISR